MHRYAQAMRMTAVSSFEHRDVVVLCPTAYEARAVRRGARLHRSRVIVTGPGADAVRRAVLKVRDRVDRVLLAGLAGGLDPSAAPGTAYAVSRVSAIDGRRLDAPWIMPRLPVARLVTAPAVVSTPVEKTSLAIETGATIVDLEGFAFAEQASEVRLRWGIIRAVSDGHDQELPPGIDSLVSPRGRTRHLRAILWALVNKQRMGDMATIVGQSMAGLQMVGRAVREALDGPMGGR